MRFALNRLRRRVTVDDLADIAHLSVRQFERRFARATGLPPGRRLTCQRVRAGAALLESTDQPIGAVADRVGLTVAGLRHHFREAMGVSPSTYRRRFRRWPGGRSARGARPVPPAFQDDGAPAEVASVTGRIPGARERAARSWGAEQGAGGPRHGVAETLGR
ncbi:helix-turn-helix domain-containing protein [Streptomyces litmocidini]|uniref:helix-turn-helix domain-containing protein n=1 Tax=Streptomyces litmocidini TaxID=67318 RepID=UPI0036FCA858